MTDKYHLSLAGEYRVASELQKRDINATVTFGHAKSTDVVAYGSNRKVTVIEVKTSQTNKFVTCFYNKYKTPVQEHPDFWVLVQIIVSPDNNFTERFFILTHSELSVIQAEHNRAYRVRRGEVTEQQRLSWEDHCRLTKNGVDNVLPTEVEESKDKWDKIVNACDAVE